MKRLTSVVTGVVVAVWSSIGCNGTPSTPVEPELVVDFTTPVVAKPGSAPFYFAEWPITIRDPMGPGGRLEFVDVIVTNRTRDQEIGHNRRPNTDFVYVEDRVPSRGALTVEAGVVFEMQSLADELLVAVQVRIDDGRTAERTGILRMADPM